ncbi:MAG: PQQ-binding-like beta-propeller repeat protein, partial [Verrucomicrobiota bacterium]
LAIVWHRDVPTETRKIDRDVLSSLGYRGTNSLPDDVVEKMEADRLSLSPRLRGKALDDWAAAWVDEHIDEKTQLSLGSWIISRFKKGKSAIPLSVYDTLLTVSSREFEDQAAVEAWINEQGFDAEVRDQIIRAIPATEKQANDVILALDAESGAEAWRFEVPGSPTGRGSSSTPAVADGIVVAALSDHLYGVDLASGQEKWRTELTGKRGPASSPLIHQSRVYLLENKLSAFDLATGESLWENKEVKSANSSPAATGNLILCNAGNGFYGVDAETGETKWTALGGGDGTPVVSGDIVVITSRKDEANLIAYRLTDEAPEQIWSQRFLARRYGASPIIFEGHVYHLGSSRHLCADLETGEIKWDREAQSSISSPILADGKLLIYENRGGFLSMIAANPDEYQRLGRTKVGALYCATPALVDQDVYIRTKESIVRFHLH